MEKKKDEVTTQDGTPIGESKEEEQKTINSILDAVKELTKVTADLKATHDKWVKAGKF